MRGKLIIFEGLDRTGKSTQSQILKENLENSTLIRFPERESVTGKQINEYLLGKQQISDEAIHLIFSANRWECKDKIIEMLNQGKNVILDRYVYSGVAYSAAKGLDFNWCLNCDIGLPKPDLIFYIEINNEEINQRKGFGEEIYENQDFQNKVKVQYEKMKSQGWIIINGAQKIEEISQFIKKTVDQYQVQQKIDCI